MFIKVPVYFDVEGSITEVGLVQEFLTQVVVGTLLDRKRSLEITISNKDRKNFTLPAEMKITLIRRSQVLDGLR